MSKALEAKVNELFEAVKNLQSLDEIKPYCEAFNEWLNTNTNYTVASLGTNLSKSGFYKKFKSLPLEQGKNAESVPKHDAQGNVTGYELKHYALVLCGLGKSDWRERNETTRVSDRLTTLDGGTEIDPDQYIDVTAKLLTSNNPHEIAVGLIAATGRRPHEILARGSFALIDGETYKVKFSGQGKKRGQSPTFEINTLFPAQTIIGSFKKLRQNQDIKALLSDVEKEFIDDISKQNVSLENKRGNSLRRVVKEFFNPFLTIREGKNDNNCSGLRAACACLITERDRPGSVGAKMLFYGMFLGHITPDEKLTDDQLKHLVTSVGYADYFVTKKVKFPTMPEKIKLSNVKTLPDDLEFINSLIESLDLPNQQSATALLVERYRTSEESIKKLRDENQLLKESIKNNTQNLPTKNDFTTEEISRLKEELSQLEAQNKQLQQQLESKEVATMETNQSSIDMNAIASMIEQIIDKKLGDRLQPQTEIKQPEVSPALTQAVIESPQVTERQIELESLSLADLWASKKNGVAEEKTRRAFLAICDYNDTVATENTQRIAITNVALRDLAGVNGQVVSAWMEQHKDEIISHNSKFGFKMGTKSNPNSLDCYANKGKDIQSLLKVVSERFLEGFGNSK